MFLDPEKARARLESEDNLANRFSRGESLAGTSSNSESQSPQEDGDIEGLSTGPDNVSVVPHKRAGSREGSSHLPVVMRNTIAIMARTGAESQENIGRAFGITQEEVSQVKNGIVKGVDENRVEKALGEMRDKALEKLMGALGLITTEKMEKCKATDLSVIASNMSKVIEKSLPREKESRDINLVVYAPELRSERNFKTIEV